MALFVDGDLSATLDHQLAKARRAVEDLPEAEPRDLDSSVITERLLGQFRVDPIALTEGAISVQAQDADIDRRRVPGLDWGFPDDPPSIRGTRVTFNVPFTGDHNLFRLKPSTWTTVVPHAVLTRSELRFIYDVQSSEVPSMRAAFDRDLGLTRQWSGWVNDEVNRFNANLEANLTSAVAQRTARLAAAAEGLEALGLPIRRAKEVTIDAHLEVAPPAPGKPVAKGPRFDVALSFAGEDRAYVQQVANHLANAGAAVFYDEFQTVELWGKDLVAHLQDIYQNQARFCVLFISQHYVTKPWPTHERRSAQARALVAKSEYILPARFDESTLPGMQPTVGYVDLRLLKPEDFARMILAKIGMGSSGG